MLVLAWLLLGIGMGCGLYDAAFAALGRIYGESRAAVDHRHYPVRGICLDRRLAVDGLGLETIGWRNTCFAWAAAHILIGLPINFFMLPAVKGAKAAAARRRQAAYPDRPHHDAAGLHLCCGLDASPARWRRICRGYWRAAGATTVQAVAAGALFGPAQVVARIIEASFLSRYHPLLSTRLACLTHPDRRRDLCHGRWRGIERVCDLFRSPATAS